MLFYKKTQLFAIYYAQKSEFKIVLSYHIELFCCIYYCFGQVDTRFLHLFLNNSGFS